MKQRLLLFNGGLQTRVAPHLIEPNQALECVNVDLKSGSLKPIKGLTSEGTTTGVYVHQSGETIISNSNSADTRCYARFGNRIYWTNAGYNVVADDSYSPNNLGEAGLFRWDNTLGKGVEAAAPTAPDGTLGLTPSGSTGILDGDYSYAYTYVDSDGIESAPSAIISVTTTNAAQVSIALSGETNAPSDIAYRRIYRTGGNNPTFNLVLEIADGTAFPQVDATRDIDVSRIEMTTLSNSAPHIGLDNLVEQNGTLWASYGNRLYFSLNGQPEYWSPLDYIQVNENITALGTHSNIVVVLTASDAYVVTGYNRDNVTLDKLPYREGCSNAKSVANVGNYLVWTSRNGVCVFDGSTVNVVTRNLLSWNDLGVVGSLTWDSFDATAIFDANLGYSVSSAIAFPGKYYGVYSEGVGILNLEDGMLASTISVNNARSIYYDDINNYLVVVTDDNGTFNMYSIDTNSSSLSEAKWKTGHIQDEGIDIKKQYRRVKLEGNPTSVTVTSGDKTFTVANRNDFFLPSGFIGNYIQFEITTSEEIRSLKYEYGLLSQ